MKKIIFASIIVILWALPSSAEIYNSPFGFRIDLPSHWLILSKQKLQDNPDLLNFEGEELKSTNKDLLNNVKNMVVSGKIEMYFNKKTSNTFYNDNINVIETVERLPQTVSEVNTYCAQAPKKFFELFGKSMTFYECGLRKVAEKDSLYSVFDGVIDGTRSIQYQIQKSPSVAIVITATSRDETFAIMSKEFDAIMASFAFHVVQKEKEAVPQPKELKGTVKCRGMTATIVGTDGNDVINGTPGNDVIHGLGGNDIIFGKGGDDIICGGDGGDNLIGGDGNDRLDGGDGDDWLDGDNDDDELYGGAGDDHLSGGYGNDRLYGDDGNDWLYGENDDDTLYGGVGDDHLEGGYGKDRLDGGDGKDRLDGGLGQDVCSGESDPGRRERCETIENP